MFTRERVYIMCFRIRQPTAMEQESSSKPCVHEECPQINNMDLIWEPTRSRPPLPLKTCGMRTCLLTRTLLGVVHTIND